MRNTEVTEAFMQRGGTELAPMSTTRALSVAVQYSEARASLVFKLRTDGFMGRGASLRFVSAFPGEDECLFPPLTYIKPTGNTQSVALADGSEVEVVEVEPTFGT